MGVCLSVCLSVWRGWEIGQSDAWAREGLPTRTDGASSIVALSTRVGEKLREAGVKAMQKHKLSIRQQISRTCGEVESEL